MFETVDEVQGAVQDAWCSCTEGGRGDDEPIDCVLHGEAEVSGADVVEWLFGVFTPALGLPKVEG